MARVLGFWHRKHSGAKLVTQVHFGEQVQQGIGRNFQEVISTQFLVKPGVGRAQIGVFGCYGAIEAIYFAF
jgi:hypothetical protein